MQGNSPGTGTEPEACAAGAGGCHAEEPTSTRQHWHRKFTGGDPAREAKHRKLQALCRLAADLGEDGAKRTQEEFHRILNDLASDMREHSRQEERRLRRDNAALLERFQAESAAAENELTDLLIAASTGVLDRTRLLHFLFNQWSSRVQPAAGDAEAP